MTQYGYGAGWESLPSRGPEYREWRHARLDAWGTPLAAWRLGDSLVDVVSGYTLAPGYLTTVIPCRLRGLRALHLPGYNHMLQLIQAPGPLRITGDLSFTWIMHRQDHSGAASQPAGVVSMGGYSASSTNAYNCLYQVHTRRGYLGFRQEHDARVDSGYALLVNCYDAPHVLTVTRQNNVVMFYQDGVLAGAPTPALEAPNGGLGNSTSQRFELNVGATATDGSYTTFADFVVYADALQLADVMAQHRYIMGL